MQQVKGYKELAGELLARHELAPGFMRALMVHAAVSVSRFPVPNAEPLPSGCYGEDGGMTCLLFEDGGAAVVDWEHLYAALSAYVGAAGAPA